MSQADRPIAIVTPMSCEMAPYMGPLRLRAAEAVGPCRAFVGRCAGGRVIGVVSGCGLVNAAAATAAAIERHAPRLLLHSGCCGGHREDLLPGDLIVGRQTVELGAGRIGPDGRIDPASTNFLHQVDPTCREGILLAAPAALVAAAMRAWDESPELHAPWPLAPSWPAGLAARPARCVAGVLGSQDQWTSHAESIRRLRDLYGQDGEDCESAALMQVAVTHGVAALAVRGVCNNDLHLALPFGDRRLDEAVEEAARRAARLVIGLLDKLGKNADIL